MPEAIAAAEAHQAPKDTYQLGVGYLVGVGLTWWLVIYAFVGQEFIIKVMLDLGHVRSDVYVL